MEAGTSARHGGPVAAFDVDKTLTIRDCVVPFMQRVSGLLGFPLKLAGSSPILVRSACRGRRDEIKAHLVRRVFAGRSVAEVDQLGREFAAQIASAWIRDDVARRLRCHQASGHQVVLVSASLDSYLVPLGEMFEVDAVLCTRLEREADGLFSGEILGGNCRGSAKVTALEEWGGTIDPAAPWLTFAYGDSRGDEPMLMAASTGVNVSRTTLSPSC